MDGHAAWKRWTTLARGRLKGALPTILFFIGLFVFVSALFGQQYLMIIAPFSVLFKLRYGRDNLLRDYVKLFFGPLLLCPLAFLATRSVWLCIGLNLLVPFLLVLWKSSQFAPKAYYGFAMTFVFMELRPLSPETFPVQLGATAACCTLLVTVLLITARPSPPPRPEESLDRLAQLLEELAEGGDAEQIRAEFDQMARTYHRMGYDRRRGLRLPDAQKQTYHLYALLFQRASYLIVDQSWEGDKALPQFSQTMRALAGPVRRLRATAGPADRAALAEDIEGRLGAIDLPASRLRIFYRSFLQLLLHFCRDSAPIKLPPWRSAYRMPVLTVLRRRLSPDRFEVRFALRLAIVMAVSCTVSLLWDFEHTYWFPLHTFLLIMPSYEESARRMVTRPIGTALGCLLVHLVYPHLPGLPGLFLFSLVMIALMYCCTPGTWIHPIFSTSYALSMATLTVAETEAIQLRLFYLLMAVALVLVANHFLLPNRREEQFRRNVKALFSIQADYWAVVRGSLDAPISTALFSEMLSQFHLVYHEAYGYLGQLPEEERAPVTSQLLLLWNMFSELEQVECLIQAGAFPPEDRPALAALAEELRARIAPPRPSLAELSLDGLSPSDLRYVLGRYLHHAKALTADSALMRT